MTREEERNKVAQEYCDTCVALKFPTADAKLKETDIIAAVRYGIEWADKHTRKGLVEIDKACVWIHLHIGELNDLYIRTAIREEFVDDFRKAMEE